MPKNTKISPECCEEVAENNTVYLEYDFESLQNGSYHDTEPDWVVLGFNSETNKNFPVPVKFCPHCSVELPGLKRRRAAARTPVCEPNLKTGECEHCHKQLMACRCQPPEYAFVPDHDRKTATRSQS